VRNIPTATPDEGIGIVEAPRGTLIHHYKTDRNGIITEVNLIVATVNNAAAICMSIEKAAKSLIKGGKVSDGLLNMVEMAFRAYDPCFACATHTLPGKMPMTVLIRNKDSEIIQTISRE
jgi:F420-non-reducing hydrogenase large subunit